MEAADSRHAELAESGEVTRSHRKQFFRCGLAICTIVCLLALVWPIARVVQKNRERAAIEAIEHDGGSLISTDGEAICSRPAWLVVYLDSSAFFNRLVGDYFLVDITQLGFRDISGAGLDQLDVLPKLRSLSIEGRLKDADMQRLGVLHRLQELSLIVPSGGPSDWHECDIHLAFLEGLTELETLSVAGYRPTPAGWQHIRSLPKLQSLTLATYLSETDLTELGKLVHLETLDISECVCVTYQGLANLAGMTQLKRLTLSAKLDSRNPAVERLTQALPGCLIYFEDGFPLPRALGNHPTAVTFARFWPFIPDGG